MIKLLYLRDLDFNPIACLATVVGEGEVSYGLSILNPKDRFSKPLAREIAVGRVQKAPISVPLAKELKHYKCID